MTLAKGDRLLSGFALSDSVTITASRCLPIAQATIRSGRLTLVSTKKTWIAGEAMDMRTVSSIVDRVTATKSHAAAGVYGAWPVLTSLPSAVSDGGPDQRVAYVLLLTMDGGSLVSEEERAQLDDLLALLSVSASGERLAKHAASLQTNLDSYRQDNAASLLALSHTLRSPLSLLASHAELLATKSAEAEASEQVDQIRGASRELLKVVSGVLDYATLEAGVAVLDEQEFDLTSMLSALMAEFRPLSADRGLQLELRLHPQTARWIIGDRQRTQQVLANLVSNAIKFTQKGKVSIHVNMNESGTLRAEISDSGRGIPEEELSFLFRPFAQIAGGLAGSPSGGGLGLATARGVLACMGGQISVQSTVGVGSTFCVEIPVGVASSPASSVLRLDLSLQPELAPMSVRRPGISLPPPTARHVRVARVQVLVAEDCVVNQRLIKAMLSHHNFAVEVVANGQAAVSRCLSGEFVAVLMDWQMPVMDGLTAIAEIRRLESETKRPPIGIVALTANARPADREACLRAGADDYLSKPISLAALRAVIERWIAPRSEVYAGAVEESVLETLRASEGREFVAELVGIFGGDAPLRIAKLRVALELSDTQELALQAHALKGGAGNLGANKLSRLAADVELLAREGDLAAAARLVLEIEREYASVAAALKRHATTTD
jgi:signal transduction histidine kinase/DNA-binding NarL/FixJ family response regulator